MGAKADAEAGFRSTLRQVLALERDVLVLSLAMFAFSLGFQMAGRYMPRYMSVIGAGSVAIGLYGSLENGLEALYPYPGGALSDRIGSRFALTLFGLLSAAGFLVWLAAPAFGVVTVGGGAVGPVEVPAVALPAGVFLGVFLVRAWKSLGLGATFAIVWQSVGPDRLATAFASTETVRRLGFLVGPLLAAAVLAAYEFRTGFAVILAAAAVVAVAATVVQHLFYEPADTPGRSFAGVGQVVADLRGMPPPLRPLLVADTLVRFANGMVYVFFVIVVTEFLSVGATLPVVGRLNPDAFFGVLLAVEMAVALLSMIPVSKLAHRVGLKPVVALGLFVYAAFPALLVSAPADPLVVAALFAFSGLRFAGMPAHKALIVGPAEANAGGRVTGSYYLVRNAFRIPAAAVGGVLYGIAPALSFGTATVVGLVGVGVFLAFGEEFEAAVGG